MHVKGNAWLARSEYLQKSFGEERWKGFLKDQAKATPFLRQPVLPISRIEAAEFLAVNDAIVKQFYGGDQQAYWRFGEQSADWALRNQLRTLFQPKEGRRFLQFSPTIYHSNSSVSFNINLQRSFFWPVLLIESGNKET